MTDLRWAWRNVRHRGWQPILAVALLAVALAANTLVFAAADSLVFRRAPFRQVDQLVELQARDGRTGAPSGNAFMSVALFEEWRQQRDLLGGVEAYLHKTIFLSGTGEPELVPASDVTVGLFELLGARPAWGRPFADGVDSDVRQAELQAVIVAESLARQRFGDPARAIGQRLETTGEPLTIVGVMPRTFRFPTGAVRIWRALDPRGPLTASTGGSVSALARLAPGASLAVAAPMVLARSGDIGKAAGVRGAYQAVAVPFVRDAGGDSQRRMFLVLLGAAACLLLLACANVASLELAGAVRRARVYAIQIAIGASRAALVRTALLEGLILVGTAAAMAAWLASAAAGALTNVVPPHIATGSANPIDLDERGAAFMLAVAAATWLLSTLPVLVFAWRANLLDLLKPEGSSASVSRGGARFRGGLAVVQIAMAVLLLVGSVLYVRTYTALMRLDKGFDSSGVVSMSLTIPPQAFGTAAERAVVADEILSRVRSRPGVIAAFEGAPPPSTGDSSMRIQQIEVDDRPPVDSDLAFPKLRVDPDYFATLKIPLVAGRMFEPGESPTNAIISAPLAARLWPNADPIGRRFRESPNTPWYYVIGVVEHVRMAQDGTTGPTRYFQLYLKRQPPPPAAAAASRSMPPPTGGWFGFMAFTARVDSRDRAADLYQTVRSVDPRNILKLEFVDDQYALHFADRLLATRVVSGFGMLAFVVSTVGIYGLMAFLVASRTREIGIRMALGADARAIRRLVLRSTLRLVAAGTVLGTAAAMAMGRWIESQLFGVRPADPSTLAMVIFAVATASLLATWHPARQAARVDPKELLRN